MSTSSGKPEGNFSEAELEFIRKAVRFLEQPSLLIQIAATVGKPVEYLLAKAPKEVKDYTAHALKSCMDIAASTVPINATAGTTIAANDTAGWNAYFHQLATVVTGAVGGFFGLPGLALELPITTGIMFRSIAAIAAEFGFDAQDSGIRFECLSVFSYGGPNRSDDAMESSFYSAKAAMATFVKNAAAFVAGKPPGAIAAAFANGTADPLVKLIARVAAEFEVAVSEKFVAQCLPLIGAATGASINAAFTGYFNSVARYHFGLKKMESIYGEAMVRGIYETELRKLPNSRNKLPKSPPPPNDAQ